MGTRFFYRPRPHARGSRGRRRVRETAGTVASRLRATDRITVSRLALVAAVAGLALLSVPLALPAATHQPLQGQRIDLELLVLTPGTDTTAYPAYQTWRAALEREGVPYATVVVPDGTGQYFDDSTLADYTANHAKFQGVILPQELTLSPSEQTALTKFEEAFGIRQVTDNAWPSAAHGLNAPTFSGTLDGITGTLTATGKLVFPYLQGNVPIPNDDPDTTEVYGHEATPLAGADFTTLVSGPNGSALVGIYTRSGGSQEMVDTMAGNEHQTQQELLRHGMISWVTRGVYLGYQRNYLDVEADDVLLPDERWNTDLNQTGVESSDPGPDEYQCTRDPADTTLPQCLPEIRMTATDVSRLASWQNANGLKIDLVFNGEGSVDAGHGDPLTSALLGSKSAFLWINHTYSHLQLDNASETQIEEDISQNLTWAASHGIAVDGTELVTGEHSGLHNPSMPAALTATGVKWIAADDSREPTQYPVGPALTVPRYPSNVYYNVATRDEELDEYNYIYFENCTSSSTTTCLTAPASWSDFLDSESSIMFEHLMGNDPRPHFAHQSNLAEDGILYSLLDDVLARYRSLFSVGLEQLSLAGAGQELERQAAWHDDASGISAFLLDGRIHVTNTTGSAIDVPLTGTTVGTVYGGQRSGVTSVPAGQEVIFDPSDPLDTAPPQITGSVDEVGGTLTVTTGSWTGTDPIGYSYQWQRSDAAAAAATFASIDGATTPTYTTIAADKGYELRVVVSASNWISAVSQAFSAATQRVGQVPATISDVALSGSAQEHEVLTAVATGVSGTAPLSTSYQWARSADGTSWTPVAGATGTMYTVAAADVGGYLRVTVTVVNSYGTAVKDVTTEEVLPATPEVLVEPSISGSAVEGRTLGANPGVWGGVGVTTSIQWERSSDGAAWAEIPGATGSTYTVAGEDVGWYVSIRVVGTNAGGTVTASSAPVGPVLAAPEVAAVSGVTLSGTAQEGETLTASADGVAGAEPLSIGYAWARSADGAGWTTIAAATGSTYTLVKADVGGYVRVSVTVSNPYGTAGPVSARVGPVQAASSGGGSSSGSSSSGSSGGSGGSSGTPATSTATPRSTPPSSPFTPPSVAPAAVEAVEVTGLRVTPVRFRVPVASSGATVSWTVSARAVLRLTVQRAAAGRMVGGTCRPPTAANGGQPSCVRWVWVGTVGRTAAAGVGKLRLADKIGGHPLRPGRYRVVFRATPAGVSGASTTTRSVGFAVLESLVERLQVTPVRFRVIGSPRGATVRWSVRAGAALQLAVQRAVTGRLVDGKCQTVSAANRGQARCVRWVWVGTIKRTVGAGAGKLRLVDEVGGRPLRPGRYRILFRATPVGVSGAPTTTRSVGFTVLEPRGKA